MAGNGDGSENQKQPQTISELPALSNRYRGAAVQDLDLSPACSTLLTDPISEALDRAYVHDYTHLTVLYANRSLCGFFRVPDVSSALKAGAVPGTDAVEKVMYKFDKKARYETITTETPLEQLEAFFRGDLHGGKSQEFAIVTDPDRKFVCGVATKEDLERFVARRPAL